MQKTNFNYEILIGEDCSTDNTKKIIERYINQYPDKIRIITSEKNVGARENVLRLFEQSRGKYIAECEGDDYWIDPFKLQKQIDYLEENPGCTMCFHAADIVQGSKKSIVEKIKPYSVNQISPVEDIITGGGGFCPTASLVYPKKIMQNPPAFYLTAHVGDYPIQLYLASQGYAYYFHDCMSVYRTAVEESWTNRMFSEGDIKENLMSIYEGDIAILDGFNMYTESKYVHEVENIILKRKFAISILKRWLKEPKSTEMKEGFDKLDTKSKLKIYALCSFPKTYVKLADIRALIVNNKLFN